MFFTLCVAPSFCYVRVLLSIRAVREQLEDAKTKRKKRTKEKEGEGERKEERKKERGGENSRAKENDRQIEKELFTCQDRYQGCFARYYLMRGRKKERGKMRRPAEQKE
jgi:predicted nuclease with TOPRIM domain